MRRSRGQVDWFWNLIDAMTGPAIAILFWAIVALIVLLSMAHGKFIEASFFEAFSAIGQIILAGAVYRLGTKQFEFSKQVAERQARIDTYPIKTEILDRFLSLFEVASDKGSKTDDDSFDEDFIESWYALADAAGRVFDSDVDTKIVLLAEKLAELNGGSEYRRALAARFAGDIAGAQSALAANWKSIVDMYFAIWLELHTETILGEKMRKSRELNLGL